MDQLATSHRFTLTIRDWLLFGTVFCATLTYNIDFAPSRHNSLPTRLVSPFAVASFVAIGYLSVRLLQTPATLAVGLTTLHAAILIVASFAYMCLNTGELYVLATMGIDILWLPFFGWVFLLAINDDPGPAQEQAMFIANVLFGICSSLGWGVVGYVIGLLLGKRAGADRRMLSQSQ